MRFYSRTICSDSVRVCRGIVSQHLSGMPRVYVRNLWSCYFVLVLNRICGQVVAATAPESTSHTSRDPIRRVWLVAPVVHFGNGVNTHIDADLLSKTGSALSFARYKQRMVQPVLPSPNDLVIRKSRQITENALPVSLWKRGEGFVHHGVRSTVQSRKSALQPRQAWTKLHMCSQPFKHS